MRRAMCLGGNERVVRVRAFGACQRNLRQIVVLRKRASLRVRRSR